MNFNQCRILERQVHSSARCQQLFRSQTFLCFSEYSVNLLRCAAKTFYEILVPTDQNGFFLFVHGMPTGQFILTELDLHENLGVLSWV